MNDNQFFDLHIHPVFKQYLSKYEDGPTTRPIGDLEGDIFLSNDVMRFADRDFLHILHSQTSISQMIHGKLTLSVANFVALEYGIANSQGLLGDVLRSGATRPLDKTYFNKVINGEISYYRLFLHELFLYKKISDASGGALPVVKILSRKSAATRPGGDALGLVLALEGGHNLCRDFVGKPGVPDAAPVNSDVLPAVVADFANQNDPNTQRLSPAALSLDRLMKALWADGLDILYLTLTHLTHVPQQLLATHAYGMKLLHHIAFYPQGCGLTEPGKDVIATAYALKDGPAPRPVLIDVKHMSLQSRLDFYEYRKTLAGEGKLPPIMATHMGVTGYTISTWKQAKNNAATYTKTVGEASAEVTQLVTKRQLAGRWGSILNNEFTFNPWSINLMNEDIVEVLTSGGMIGVSLDTRILGYQHKIGLAAKNQPEYLSPPEFKKIFGAAMKNDAPVADDPGSEDESWLVPTPQERQPISFCFNIVHILAVANEYQIADAWKQLCIGSDFDGLIDPLDTSSNSGQMADLERAMLRWLPVAADAYDKEHASGNVMAGMDVAAVVRAILYENGLAFIQKWLAGNL